MRKPHSDRIRGRIDRPRPGFAFLEPEEGSGPDIYIPRHGLGGALHGDRVVARITAVRTNGRREGVVVDVLERAVQRVTGRYRAAGREGWLEPFDRRFPAGVRIPAGRSAGAEEGEAVGCELTRMAGRTRPAEGRVVERLGQPDDPAVALRVMIWKHGLREEFPVEALRECERLPEDLEAGAAAGRADFRHLNAVTIDPPDARDHDDAISLERLEGGRFRVGIHIADVAHLVREGSAVDDEARRRGTSVYFPGHCLPMLPEALSNRLCSLQPGRDRLTMSVCLTVGADGGVEETRIVPAVIRSRARLTYGEVAEILEGNPPGPLPGDLDRRPFLDLERIAGKFGERRRARGSIDLDLPDPALVLDERGDMIGIDPRPRNAAHAIVEEFMLAANEAVARRLFGAKIPALYRIHDRPDPVKLETFNRVLEAFGFNLPGPYLDIRPAAYQDLLLRLRGRPEEPVLTMMLLRSLQQARYSDEPRAHFGLALSLYTHFTSPIRRYPDLVVHRMVKRLLEGRPPDRRERQRLAGPLPELARLGSRAERAAEAAERELTEWKKIGYLAERVGDEFTGILTGVTEIGCFVALEEVFIDGLIPISTLPPDRYRVDERRQLLRGARTGRVLRLGDRVRVRLDRVCAWPHRIDCSLLARREPGRKDRPGTVRAP